METINTLAEWFSRLILGVTVLGIVAMLLAWVGCQFDDSSRSGEGL